MALRTVNVGGTGGSSSSSSPSSGYDDYEQKKREAEAAEAARRARIQAQIDANNLEIARLNKKIQQYKTMQGQISTAQSYLSKMSNGLGSTLVVCYTGAQQQDIASKVNEVSSGGASANASLGSVSASASAEIQKLLIMVEDLKLENADLQRQL